MFKERIKEVLELVLEAEDKTDIYLDFEYNIQGKVLCICAEGHVFAASNNKYMEESIQEMKDYLKALIEGGETQ
jgi:hypothetical protein